MRIARVNVYLPDELADQARREGLNVSALAQDAIEQSLLQSSTSSWLASLAQMSSHTATHADVIEALDAVRKEAPTRHG
jgi:post-segregation antitoxin (ccd killing protein)